MSWKASDVNGVFAGPPCWHVAMEEPDGRPMSDIFGRKGYVLVRAESIDDAIAAARKKFPDAMVTGVQKTESFTHPIPDCPTPNWDKARAEHLLGQASKAAF